jgi:hypothetical protein
MPREFTGPRVSFYRNNWSTVNGKREEAGAQIPWYIFFIIFMKNQEKGIYFRSEVTHSV